MGRAWREAERLEGDRAWAAAGGAWMAIAEAAWAKKDLVRARDAASRAGDAWRREDQPARAAKALKLAWDAGRRGAMDTALLAAVMLDAGQADVAMDLVAGVEGGEPAGQALLLDTRLGLSIALGRVDEARADLEALDALNLPAAGIARVFRQAQLDRLDGLLERADQGFAAVATALFGMERAAGPAAAAMAERGELALLVATLGGGSAADALPHLLGAAAGWKAAARAGPAQRAQAWVLRARAEAGEEVLASPILDWARGADERGVPLLAADLRVCHAVATRDPGGLEGVILTLERAPLARGRVRVIQAELGGPADLDRALDEVVIDAPWSARALLALGQREGDEGMMAEARGRMAVILGLG